MDYSAISHDPDHPAGTSPWASPRPTQTTFPASVTSDIPPAPLPPQDPYNAESQPTEAPGFQENETGSPDLSARLQGAHLGEPGYADEQSQQSPQQHGQQPRSQLPARYQTGPRQNPRQPAPVYRIQAKVTGLERTGKKDPILRFDVHVSGALLCLALRLLTTGSRRISPNSGQRSIETFVAPMPSLSSLRTI